MLITICNLSYYNLYHITMCFVKINHQSIKSKKFAGGCLIQVLEFHYIRIIRAYLSDYFNALTFESHYSNMWTKEFVS